MLLLALVSMLLAGKPLDVSGQQAIDKVRQLVRSFGDHSELRIQGLSRYSLYDARPEVWSVKLSGKPLTYSAYVEVKTGKVRFVSSDRRLHSLPEEKGVTLSVPEVARHAEALLRASGERRPVGTPYRQLNPKGEVMFWYPLLVNGYRFFGGACSDQFWFMGHSGKFIEYHAAADPPPVNASTPKIDQKTALARVKTLMEEQRRDAARKGFGEVVYSGNPSFDLGYYVPEKETQGRLTWRVTVQSELRSQFASRPWNGIFLIDAVTGDQIHFTVVPTP